ncbi:MAG TPA: hypothetical protein VGS19_08110, partial [Streptosporangiaceae bacterium]|nr:hypothetical protein [Streptosporangiaceae bacterium]
MELFTTSFARWRPGDGSSVVISLGVPRWRPEAAQWPRCWELCPRWRYFSAPDEVFEAEYRKQLDAYGP